MLTIGADSDAIVMDFFAGSGATGHSVMERNATDGGHRRFVLVQLPEPLDPGNADQRAAAELCDQIGVPRNIAELTKERLRRAARKVYDENPMFGGDLGFRVFRLDSSNIKTWEPNRNELPKSVEDSVHHLKAERTEQDILFELLLKLGLDLCVPIEAREIDVKDGSYEVQSIGGGAMLVCLAPEIQQADAEALALGLTAWHKQLRPAGETTVIFRDSAFADDVVKSNLTAILQQHWVDTDRRHGLTVRSL